MKKLAIQFIVFAGSFFLIWMGLAQLPWTKWLHAQNFSAKRQKAMSDVFIKAYGLKNRSISDEGVKTIIDTIKQRICISNKIDTATIHIYIYQNPEINAYSLPGGNIMVNTALIAQCDNPEMLAGVIAHEIGHIESGHIKKRMAKEIALSVAMLFGGDNLGIIKTVLKELSSGKFDRTQETEADTKAVHYLATANINPLPMADFFDKLHRLRGDTPEIMEWISTHPNSIERANLIRKLSSKQYYSAIINDSSWHRLQAASININP